MNLYEDLRDIGFILSSKTLIFRVVTTRVTSRQDKLLHNVFKDLIDHETTVRKRGEEERGRDLTSIFHKTHTPKIHLNHSSVPPHVKPTFGFTHLSGSDLGPKTVKD